jgi:hypothetical protein
MHKNLILRDPKICDYSDTLLGPAWQAPGGLTPVTKTPGPALITKKMEFLMTMIKLPRIETKYAWAVEDLQWLKADLKDPLIDAYLDTCIDRLRFLAIGVSARRGR